jgi:transposase-like protein
LRKDINVKKLQRRDQEDICENGVTRQELEVEKRRLRKENNRLQMEREILKKPAAFFSLLLRD